MVSCYNCGRAGEWDLPSTWPTCELTPACFLVSGHPRCLTMDSEELINTVMSYNWHCIECKACEMCGIQGDDVSAVLPVPDVLSSS